MRPSALAPVLLLTGGCWTPGPGQVDPTRYPWDQRKAAPGYCVVSLETGNAAGITVGGGGTTQMACSVSPNSR
jgi:hypothetical protein